MTIRSWRTCVLDIVTSERKGCNDVERCRAMSSDVERLEQELCHLVIVQSDLAQKLHQFSSCSVHALHSVIIQFIKIIPLGLRYSQVRRISSSDHSFPHVLRVSCIPCIPCTAPMTSATTRPSPLPRKTTSTTAIDIAI